MAWVETRITRTTQPQDAAQLDRRVIAAYSPGIESKLSAIGAPTRVVNQSGVGFLSPTTSVGYSAPVAGSTPNKTLIFVGEYGPTGGAGFCTLHNGGSYASMLYANSGGYLQYFYANGASLGGIGFLPLLNRRFIAVGSYDGVTARSAYRFLDDGVRNSAEGAASAVSPFNTFQAGSFFQASRPVTTNFSAVLDVALSESEIQSLLDNPWQLFEPEVQRVWIDDATEAAPPGNTTGTLSATETGSDTAVLSGQIVVQGTLAASDTGQDTASLAGKVIVTGTLAAQETGSDTAALNGSASVTLTGTLSATEVGSDTATLTGKVLVQGSLSAVETGSDTALINGSSVTVTTGSINAQESGGDTAAMTGKVLVQALIDAAEQGADTASLVGQIVITGVLSASEVGSDTAAIRQTQPLFQPSIYAAYVPVPRNQAHVPLAANQAYVPNPTN